MSRLDTRARIIEAAAQYLRQDGPSAVTTRGVAEKAGVQPPTIYRIFGDKDGLLEAVAEHVMSTFVSAKARGVETASAADVDPLDDLRNGWRSQIDFGIANPALFRLLSDPDRVVGSPAAQSGRRVLESRVNRVAATGRLAVSEQRAVDIIQAAGIGAIQVLLSTAPERRDPGLADAMYEAVLNRIIIDPPPRRDGGTMAATVAFRAIAPQLEALSHAERSVLIEWLDRAVRDE